MVVSGARLNRLRRDNQDTSLSQIVALQPVIAKLSDQIGPVSVR